MGFTVHLLLELLKDEQQALGTDEVAPDGSSSELMEMTESGSWIGESCRADLKNR